MKEFDELKAKLEILGIHDMYFEDPNDNIFIDISKAYKSKIVIPDFVYGIVSTDNKSDRLEIIKELEFGRNIKYIQVDLLRRLKSLERISDLTHIFNLDCTKLFSGCSKLKYAPMLPKGVRDMTMMFKDCENLLKMPKIPDTVRYMVFSFDGCKSLKIADEIPKGVILMLGCFNNCINLEEINNIYGMVQDRDKIFNGCKKLGY